MSEPTDTPILLLNRDLMIGSRIAAAAAALGQPLRSLRDPARLAEVSAERLIVDLNLDGALEAAAAWKAGEPARQVIGFVKHTDAEMIRQARAAGIDRVMARSKFVEQMPRLLGRELHKDGPGVGE